MHCCTLHTRGIWNSWTMTYWLYNWFKTHHLGMSNRTFFVIESLLNQSKQITDTIATKKSLKTQVMSWWIRWPSLKWGVVSSMKQWNSWTHACSALWGPIKGFDWLWGCYLHRDLLRFKKRERRWWENTSAEQIKEHRCLVNTIKLQPFKRT